MQDRRRMIPPAAKASARGEIQRGRSRGTAGGQLPDAAGSPSVSCRSLEPGENRRRGPGASRGDSSGGQQGTAAGGRMERGRTATGRESTASRQASPGRFITLMLQATEVRSEGELSGSDEEVRQDITPSGGSSAAAMGSRPSQPDGGQPRLVWILGHSYGGNVRPEGRQLGISRREASIRWLGFPGMGWGRVVPEVERYA
ncbi:hypothetical protein AB205_0145070 [Aquarana catesbeiana]|uniref:Uncharacterized protein n=1 Tax=Aquarana catesbeiana TaxID=8400 RepID=A0A2G9SLR1_AQUCT|nr:hypothetical protein AB205_0145070 [Aquarana catesbeiana]